MTTKHTAGGRWGQTTVPRLGRSRYAVHMTKQWRAIRRRRAAGETAIGSLLVRTTEMRLPLLLVTGDAGREIEESRVRMWATGFLSRGSP